ncbi:DNA polymerase III subunit alpha [Megasphaera cerevisiae DSM 20462]|jgi:DNA polymerase-3 subunit alpha (Gram-positive type)|uniref:DNA polymerase III PolC-type n=1 Tax=Megasphaera cerevisiae DSM 20462 TaxID=1122219 RepID=A0A0J6WZV6_9FIRM|nr:PolC-type DNA polymerase III [Megasphaera cerevisiae]KMO87427.1 DNA polymerase III subunit alpha [Megasphaera cerevisiae DSM 20462]MCI1750744.1 PolC-type DNA polymerase III [Megasphaera cerevisiae]OKY53921.1 DNA polymerase III subunit alpha [Megasphaera cerevisiae]SJZ36182.1 DNA polymerase-3 subunit alpha [Megasphaera cerevisiae DSM 20462]
MKVWHIVPKQELMIPIADGQYAAVEEICASHMGKKWHVQMQSACEISDMDGLKNAVCRQLSLEGEVDVACRVAAIHHGGDMPLALPEDDPIHEIASISVDDMDGYDIPHEDCYESIYSEDDDLYDEEYRKACKSAENGETLGSTSRSAPAGGSENSRVWLGRAFSGDVLSINDVQGEERNDVIFRGKVVKVEFRELKSKRILLTFQLADASNGISAKKFIDVTSQAAGSKYRRKNTMTADEYDHLTQQLRTGAHVRVRGNVQYDNYQNDYVLNVNDIIADEGNTVEREDHNPTPRVELHLHTVMSDMDALITVKQLIKTVKKWHHPAIAVTDHGVVQSFPLLQEISTDKTNNIKVIYGMEGYLFDDKIDQSYHIIILAKNQVGIRNLYKLVSISHLKYIYRGRPRIPRSVLNEYREGLILGSACEAGELVRSMVQKKLPYEELKKIADYYDYLEIQPITNNQFLVREGFVADDEGLRNINRTILKIGDELGKMTVATCDAHFLNPEDKIYREILMTGKGFKDAQYQPDLYFRTTDEMLAEFSYLGEERAREVVITNPNKVNDWIDHVRPVPKETLYFPQIAGSSEALKNMCYEKAHQIYGDPLPQIVADRLTEELTSILGHGFGVLYYIAHKLVKHSNDDGYLVGSRGSVGSSFVATMSDITEVNPLPPHYVCPHCQYSQFFTKGEVGGGFDLPDKSCPHCGTSLQKNGHNIPFAIFLGFDGDKVPDIDLNFSGEYHPKAHKYTEELFGKDNVFRAGTIGAVKDKTAYGYVMKWAEARGINVNDAYINSLVNGCTGVKSTTGQHPGGVMVIPRDMDVHHFTPVQYPANKRDSGIITTHFDYHSIEGRLVKLDILGHDDPTVIRMLEDMTGVSAKTISFDDPETMSLFSSTKALGITPEQLGSKVGSLGIPEFGTAFVRKMLVDTHPKTFSELVRISGFSHGTDVWLNNAQDLITSGTVPLKEAVSTRDDIMNYLIQHDIKPKTSFKVMENVRKGKGIDKLNKLGQKTTDYEGELKAGHIPQWFIDSCQKIGYLFPRAHAVAYVMMAFRIAWFKINYPLAYYAAFFTIRAKAFKLTAMIHGLEGQRQAMKAIEAKGKSASKIEQDLYASLELAVEMSLRGFSFMNVDIRHSAAAQFTICDGKILPPLTAIDGLGENVAEQIVTARAKAPFSSKADLKLRGKASQSLVDIMTEEGCLGDLPEDEQIDLFAM